MRRPWEVWDKERVQRFIQMYGDPFNAKFGKDGRMKLAASLIEGDSLLDISCGVGHLYLYTKDKVDTYVGADNEEEMLKMAREFLPEATFVHGDLYDMSNLDIFDSVVCQSTLIHLPEIETPIREMWKHTRLALIFSIPLASRKVIRKYEDMGDKYLLSHAETQGSIEKIIMSLPDFLGWRAVQEPETKIKNTYFKVWKKK